MNDAFDALFDEFIATAHRLEGLGTYAIPREDPGLRAFRDGTARPERSVRTSPWVARMAVSTVVHGKLWSRTRVIDDPLTDYELFELPSYIESQTAGEEIRLIGRDVAIELAGDIGPDVWVFDIDTDRPFAAVMRYGADGAFEGFDRLDGPEAVQSFADRAALLHAHAVPLPEYLANRNRMTIGG